MFNYYVYYIHHCNTIIVVIVILLNSIQANGLTVFVLCIAMIVATTINPADSTVLRKSQLTVVQLDLDIHRQTIQTQHCYLCQVNVYA